ncbi:MAG: hypothetical protein LBQ96_09155 [Fusobacteriaceae bacterium]|jgi:predicted metal-dependent HD superfamily phosphohydrolase|nr:hypothetical protein [Fusobacteriaceae bacterium]
MLEDLYRRLLKKYMPDESYISACWEELRRLYAAETRYYHNFSHLRAMWEEARPLLPEIGDPDALLLAIFYHDAVYDVTRRDNEEKSAELFERHMKMTAFPPIDFVKELILQTKTHAESPSFDVNTFTDLDLSILGSSPEKYRAYAEGIRKEYGRMDPGINRSGRRKILEYFLTLPAIYKTPYFYKKYEKPARENLSRELRELA